jgi:heme oxygenase
MILQRLREETRQEHQSLEKKLIPYIKSINSNDSYARLLQMFYSYYQPVEKAINSQLDELDIKDLHERRKSEAIEEDMSVLGVKKEDVPADFAPEIDSKLRALGALYVLEGSTLGGKVITEIIAKNNPEFSHNAFHFFNAYGEKTMEKWKSFQQSLDNYTEVQGNIDEIVTGAANTFSSLEHWVDQQLLASQP